MPSDQCAATQCHEGTTQRGGRDRARGGRASSAAQPGGEGDRAVLVEGDADIDSGAWRREAHLVAAADREERGDVELLARLGAAAFVGPQQVAVPAAVG